MSKFDTVYDAFISNLETYALTRLDSDGVAKRQMFDPYNVENNPDVILRNGWGMRFNGGAGSQPVFKHFRNEHVLSVVFTREIVRTDSQTTILDTQVKNLVNDIVGAQAVLFDKEVDGILDELSKIALGAVNPVETVVTDRNTFLVADFEIIITIDDEFA